MRMTPNHDRMIFQNLVILTTLVEIYQAPLYTIDRGALFFRTTVWRPPWRNLLVSSTLIPSEDENEKCITTIEGVASEGETPLLLNG